MKYEERDFSYLRGSEIKIVDFDGKSIDCIVPGIDWNKGISIVNIDDPNDELVCLNKGDYNNIAIYKTYFTYTVNKIKNGKLDLSNFDSIIDIFNPSSGKMSKCAFK